MLLENLLILGYFNIRWNILTDSNLLKCNDIIDSFTLKQDVNSPINIKDNVSDLMISREDEDMIRNLNVTDMISNHANDYIAALS